MAAPPVSARVIPSGFKMPDGFKTLITFANNPAIQIWEETVKPVGWDGGDKIDTTTMHNITYRTFAARKLKTIADGGATFAFDPDCWTGLQQEINLEQSITFTFPDHSQLAVWGYLQKFENPDFKEGEMPKATGTIVATNWDPVNFVEAGPNYVPAPGT